VVFPDEGHGFLNKANVVTTATRLLAFLERHL
jgi:dipeptidyl aminopeptidase/acylaminoacyl peptidase